MVYCYQLRFSNRKRYVGISGNPEGRYRGHLKLAAKGVKLAIYGAIRKHGAPKMKVLAQGTRAKMIALEIKLISKWKLRDPRYGYNMARGGDGIVGYVPEIAAKISRANRRFFAEHGYTAEWRAKIGAASRAFWAKEITPTHRANLVRAAKERWAQPGFRKKLSRIVSKATNTPEYLKGLSERSKAQWAKLTAVQRKAAMKRPGMDRTGTKQSARHSAKIGFGVRWRWAEKRVAKEMWAAAA